MTATKHCPRCQHTLPTGAFTRDKNTPDGYATYCRTCRRNYRATHQRTPAQQLEAAADAASAAITAAGRAGLGIDVGALRAIKELRQAATRIRTGRQ